MFSSESVTYDRQENKNNLNINFDILKKETKREMSRVPIKYTVFNKKK